MSDTRHSMLSSVVTAEYRRPGPNAVASVMANFSGAGMDVIVS